ncbi:MAG: hypothetical protein RLN76_03265 [Phycisphaeraceae bacterium]
MMMNIRVVSSGVLVASVSFLLAFSEAQALSPRFSLSDSPAQPVSSEPGIIPGSGSLFPFTRDRSGASSPTLAAYPFHGDAWLLGQGGTPIGYPPGSYFDYNTDRRELPWTAFSYVDAVSTNLGESGLTNRGLPYKIPGSGINLVFSVNGTSGHNLSPPQGLPDAISAQTGVLDDAQIPSSDIFFSSRSFTHPVSFLGSIPSQSGYAGDLSTVDNDWGGNGHLLDDVDDLGLIPQRRLSGGDFAADGDNVDGLILRPRSVNPEQPPASYLPYFFSLNPDEALRKNITNGLGLPFVEPETSFDPAAIYHVDTQQELSVYARQSDIFGPDTTELQYVNEDAFSPYVGNDIDALAVWNFGDGEVISPGDFALFSLSKGSAIIEQVGRDPVTQQMILDPGDVFLTFFNGSFVRFARDKQLGFDVISGMEFDRGENLDALDFVFSGDFNVDDRVDLVDLSILAGNFGSQGGWLEGDGNGDQIIDLVDLSILANNFGSGLQVPEPSCGLVFCGLVGLLCRSGVRVS